MSKLGKRAKILTAKQRAAVFGAVARNRYPERDSVMLCLSHFQGLRAKEIASITWGMVTESDGSLSADISLQAKASKGGYGGRVVPMHSETRAALKALRATFETAPSPGSRVITSERGKALSPASVATWFWVLYRDLGFSGASSHSGRRGFITSAAREISRAGGSLRDVQDLAGHANIATTQGYIEVSESAKRNVIKAI